eukprot:s2227_g4.t1
MQLDQASIDHGSWYLASELGLEAGPPMSALDQHKTPNVLAGESPYSRILDSRWAEVSLAHLREQAPQGESKSQRGGRACCMNEQGEVPAHVAHDHLHHSSGAHVPHLPGSGASTVLVAALMNSMPRWLLKSHGKLRSFLLSILEVPRSLKRASTSIPCSAVWPMPIPYPEVFTKGSDPISGLAHLKRLVSIQVVCLSWLSLGCPEAAPGYLAIGTRLKARQWTAVKYMEHLCYDGNTPEEVDAALMGRSAAKVESMEEVLAALSRAVAFLKEDENLYFSSRLTRPPDMSSQFFAKRLGRKIGKLNRAAEMTAKPLVAERLVFPGPPQFDPGPLLDPGTRALYERPLDCCADYVEFAGEDLRDFFYQFKAGEQRTYRNILSDPVTIEEARFIFGKTFEWSEIRPVWVALSSLAMGDTLACEFAQGSHVAVCLQNQVCTVRELLTLKDPLPRGLLHVGIIVDDLVILEQCLRADWDDIRSGNLRTEADTRASRAQKGYSQVGLETNDKKRFSNEALSRF